MIIIRWFHWKVTVTVTLWWITSWYYKEVTLWVSQDCHLKTPFWSLWALHCDEWSNNITMDSHICFPVSKTLLWSHYYVPLWKVIRWYFLLLGNSPQNSYHDDFRTKSPNDSYMKVKEWRRCIRHEGAVMVTSHWSD